MMSKPRLITKLLLTVALHLVFEHLSTNGPILRSHALQITSNYFHVVSGFKIDAPSIFMTSSTLRQCAALCHSMYNASGTSNSCVMVTFNPILELCTMTTDPFAAVSVVGPEFKTVIVRTFSGDCGPPAPIPNGYFEYNDTMLGDVANLECEPWYEVNDVTQATITCSDFDTWTAPKTNCVFNTTVPGLYEGTSFVTGFQTDAAIPTLYILSSGIANVRVQIPSINIDDYITITTNTYIKTYSTAVQAIVNYETASKGVLVTSDVPITLYSGKMSSMGSSDGTLVFPETSLGDHYITVGHESTIAGNDSFLVIATTDNTQLVITPAGSGPPDVVYLNRLDTHKRYGIGLSGTEIGASAPVAVISGHSCANIPDNSQLYCDYIEEMIQPVSSYGQDFAIPYMWPRAHFTIGITVAVDFTEVFIIDGHGITMSSLTDLMKGDVVYQTFMSNSMISLAASAPIQVTQYGHGSNLADGDPSMLVVPPIGRFGSLYRAFVPTGYDTNTLTVMFDELYANEILLNNVAVTPSASDSLTVPGYGKFYVKYFAVTGPNYYEITTNNPLMKFAAFLYGRRNNVEYSWNLGMIL